MEAGTAQGRTGDLQGFREGVQDSQWFLPPPSLSAAAVSGGAKEKVEA